MLTSSRTISVIIGATLTAILLSSCGMPVIPAGTTTNGTTNSSTTESTDADETSATTSPMLAFNSAVDSPLTDDKLMAIDVEMRAIIESVFGKAKLTAIMNDTANYAFNIREYTIARFATAQDSALLIDALKAKKFVIDTTSVTSTDSIVSAHTEKYQIFLGFPTQNEHKINLTISLSAE